MTIYNRRSNPSPDAGDPVDHATALAVAKIVTGLIPPNKSVIGGGLAMQMYGFSRATKDVDIIATKLPDGLKRRQVLSFGGCSYDYDGVPVDVIVRDDNDAGLYRDTVEDPHFMKGLPVASATHMALIKCRSGRDKDQGDLAFLIRQKLFTSKNVHRLAKRAYGAASWVICEEFDDMVAYLKFRMSRERSKYDR